ncbi:hypothetical protein [Streptomyces celluloflavus]|uniref:hypothetical protein n=1 Tax=Streptomyces celluloflavus TaxID=58344 RepID=UPI003667845E
MNTTPIPAPNQIWADNDPRGTGRYLRIVAIDASHATVRAVAWNADEQIAADLPGARTTRIRLGRFRPTSTGYRYVGEST